MPSQFCIRSFVENAYYHVFNRGVEKRNIFCDKEDFRVFYYLLKNATIIPDSDRPIRRMNFASSISIASYCLMPNHFHLLLHQKKNLFLDKFMKSLSVSYTLYFNKKYRRVGSLFQGTYRAKLVESDEYLIHLTRYIHENPKDVVDDYFSYTYSSLRAYLHPPSEWLEQDLILNLCGNDYRKFLNQGKNDSFKMISLQG